MRKELEGAKAEWISKRHPIDYPTAIDGFEAGVKAAEESCTIKFIIESLKMIEKSSCCTVCNCSSCIAKEALNNWEKRNE